MAPEAADQMRFFKEGLKGWKGDINQKLHRAGNWEAKRSFVEKKIAQPKKKMVCLLKKWKFTMYQR